MKSASASVSSSGVFLGVDIGGTKVGLTAIDRDKRQLNKSLIEIPTEGHLGPAHTLNNIAHRAEILLGDFSLRLSDVEAIGVGVPSPILESGVLLDPPNLGHVAWNGLNVRELLKARFRKPVAVGNDGDFGGLAAHTEFWRSDADSKSSFYFAAGTGLGTSYICKGRVHRGRNGMTAEGGHIVIKTDDLFPLQWGNPGPDVCGNPLRAEMSACYIGLKSWIVERAIKDQHPNSCALRKIADKSGIKAAAAEVRTLASQGDWLAEIIVDCQLKVLARVIFTVDCLLYPDALIIGGGLGEGVPTEFREKMLRVITKEYEAQKHPKTLVSPKIAWTGLGDGAQVYGAALSAMTDAS